MTCAADIATRVGMSGQVIRAWLLHIAQLGMNTCFRMFLELIATEKFGTREKAAEPQLSAKSAIVQQMIYEVYF